MPWPSCASIPGGILGILLGAAFLVAACLHLKRCDQIQARFQIEEVLAAEIVSEMRQLRDLDLTEGEKTEIAEIRNEYRPKIVRALEGLRGTLTPGQAKVREDALKAGKSRREVIATLQLTDDQKAKVESVGKECGRSCRKSWPRCGMSSTPSSRRRSRR